MKASPDPLVRFVVMVVTAVGILAVVSAIVFGSFGPSDVRNIELACVLVVLAVRYSDRGVIQIRHIVCRRNYVANLPHRTWEDLFDGPSELARLFEKIGSDRAAADLATDAGMLGGDGPKAAAWRAVSDDTSRGLEP